MDSDDVLSYDAIYTLVLSLENSDIITGVTVNSKINGENIFKISHLYPPIEGNIIFKNKHFDVLIKAMESALTPVAQNRLYKKEFIDKYHLRLKMELFTRTSCGFETMLLARNVKFINNETYFTELIIQSLSQKSW